MLERYQRHFWDFVVNQFSNILNVLRGVADVFLGWFGTSWNIARNLHIFVCQSVVNGWIFRRSSADFKGESDLITAVIDSHRILRIICTNWKWFIIIWTDKVKCTSDTGIFHNLRLGGVPVNIRTENGDLPIGQFFKILHLTGFHNTLSIHRDILCGVVNFDVA